MSGGRGNVVQVWDTESGELSTSFNGHTADIRSVAWHPEGKLIVSASDDKTIRIWDVASQKLLQVLRGHIGAVTSVAISPDGKFLASGSDDDSIRIWELPEGKLVQTLNGHTNDVHAVAWHPSGKFLGSGGSDHMVRVWDLAAGKLLHTLKGHKEPVLSVAWSPDGKWIASGGRDEKVVIWDFNTQKMAREFPTKEGAINWVYSVSWSPDGKRIAAGNNDDRIRIWDTESGKLLNNIRLSPVIKVLSVAWNPDGKQLASGSWSARVPLQIFETQNWRLTKSFSGRDRWVLSLSATQDAKIVASAERGGKIRLWDVDTGSTLRTFSIGASNSFVVGWSKDGEYLIVSGADIPVRLYQTKTGELLSTFDEQTIGARLVGLSSDQKLITLQEKSKAISLWDTDSGKRAQKLFDLVDPYTAIAFSPNGELCAIGNSDKTIHLRSTKTGQTLRTLTGHMKNVNSFAWSPDGTQLASGSDDQTVQLWEAASGRPLRTLKGHSGWVGTVRWSRDGKWIISASGDKTVKIWEAQSGKQLHTLKGYNAPVRALHLSQNGRFLITGSDDREIKLWDTRNWSNPGSILSLPEDNWLAYTDDGYFHSSDDALRYVKWRRGEQTLDNEQYKAQHYRPDLVALRLKSFTAETNLLATNPTSQTGMQLQTQAPPQSQATPVVPKPNVEVKDTKPPLIRITAPDITRGVGTKKSDSKLRVAGQVTDESGISEVTVRGLAATLDEQGNFSAEILLKLGNNPIKVIATDIYGNKAEESFTIRREEPPVAEAKPSVPQPKPDPVPTWAVRKTYALVIGNNKYQHLAALKTAIADAEQVERVLRENFGYATTLLKDAKREQIVLALSEYRRQLDVNADLLIYYAGHGYFDTDVDKAYWLPVDARDGDVSNWISADDVTTSIKGMRAKHVLVVSDSCYSGTLARNTVSKLTTPLEHDRYLRKMAEGTSRTLMASGGNEPVLDGGGGRHSIFASALLRGLEQLEPSVFTADELFFQFVREPVAGKSAQTPEYNPLRNSGHESGDFVFVRRKP